LLPKKSPKARRAVRQARLGLECLEAREVPAVTPHGGAVLPNVQVQALYLGSDWQNNSTYYNQSRTLDNFLGTLVSGSYMDMLHNAGYSDNHGHVVGRGNAYTGGYSGANIDKTQQLTDSTIRQDLLDAISTGKLRSPMAPSVPGGLGGNNLYVIFVEDNVVVSDPAGKVSSKDITGYHAAFRGTYRLPSGYDTSSDIHYAVVAYPGGSNLNAWWLKNAQDFMTVTASHEVAEAVTDPEVWLDSSGWHGTGWHDGTNGNSLGKEIGDISQWQTVYLNGYAVSREADKNGQAMTPAGARAVNPVNFVLTTDGKLYLISSGSSPRWIAEVVASISDQGIDNYGHAMIDVVFTDGRAAEYHEGLAALGGNPWTWLYNNTDGRRVTMARAGQGVSYVLYNNGTLEEYKDWGSDTQASNSPPTRTTIDTSGLLNSIRSIDAGTDRYGVNMVTEVKSTWHWTGSQSRWVSEGYEVSDSTGKNYLGSGVATLSAGQLGNIGILYTGGNATWYSEATGNSVTEGSNVTQFTMGTDQNGNVQFDMLDGNGTLRQYSATDGWSARGGSAGIKSISKANAGVLVLIWGGGYAAGFNNAVAVA
jgi:hypothetical protein